MPVAWITGGARRIGKGLALRLAELGYDISFTYRTSQQEAETVRDQITGLGRVCVTMKCDVRIEGELENVFRRSANDIGVPDVVISNVGVYPARQNISMVNEQDVTDALAINTLPLLTIGRVYHELCTQHGSVGRIVSIGSLGAHEIWRDRIAYNVSKSALHTMVQTLARGLAPVISVNSVAPGIIEQPSDVAEHERSGLVGLDRIPMQRYGNIDDVFEAVWFFTNATPYITGQTILVDGGYHLTR